MIYDISPRITPALPVWPGDIPPSREILADIRDGNGVNLSAWRSTVHVGAHADAPAHVLTDGPAIDAVALESFIGPAQVLRVATPAGSEIRPEHLPGPLTTPRILLATGSWKPEPPFRPDFSWLSLDLADLLAQAGVRLLAVDTPSVDAFDSTTLPVHRRLLGQGTVILEGVDLRGVPEGVYELVALPLRLGGFEASPVRAVLRPVSSEK